MDVRGPTLSWNFESGLFKRTLTMFCLSAGKLAAHKCINAYMHVRLMDSFKSHSFNRDEVQQINTNEPQSCKTHTKKKHLNGTNGREQPESEHKN